MYLPFDFSDEYTGCLRCERKEDRFVIVDGFSLQEGWSVNPSDISDYIYNIRDFQASGIRSFFTAQASKLSRFPIFEGITSKLL